LWMAQGRRRKDVAALAGVSLPTVDRWLGPVRGRGGWRVWKSTSGRFQGAGEPVRYGIVALPAGREHPP
jgi:hypothetical protein